MRFGAHMYLWADTWSDKSLYLIDHVKTLGLDCFEIGFGDELEFTASHTRDKAKDAGVELIVSPGGIWPMEADISCEDADNQRKGLAWHKRAIDMTASVEASAYTGALYGHPGHVERRLPTTDEFKRTSEHLNTLAEYAQVRGINLVLEPMSHFRTHMVNRPDQAMSLIEMTNHPNLLVLLDTYHLVTEIRNYAEAVHTVGDKLWGIHACENDRGAPGGGIVPWESFFKALKETNFKGYMGVESYNSGSLEMAPKRGLFNNPCPDGDAFVKHSLAFFSQMMKE
ncbi:MAG: sugar phosphate isomerase/epimerase family protein [bacterium]